MASTSITDFYLPPEHLSKIESLLLRESPSMAGHLYTAQEVEATDLRYIAVPVDQSIGSITRKFPDGPTYFVFTAAKVANAAIARFQGFQCIVITASLPFRVVHVLRHFTSNQNLCNYIRFGTAVSEPVGEALRTREEAVEHLYETDMPNSSDEQAILAYQLNHLVVYLITAHEIGHFALGHRQIHTAHFMDETDRKTDPVALALKRALEWDADSFAFAATVYLALSDFRKEPMVASLLTDPQTSLRAVALAAYCFFSVMDSSKNQDIAVEERTHPRPLVRMGLVTFKLAAMMQPLGWMMLEDSLAIMAETNRAFEVTLFEIAGGVMEKELAERLTTELDAEFDQLLSILDKTTSGLDRSRLSDLAWAKFL
ncbi:hypothetical protein HF264_19555 [Rhizobium leguminosarum]|uniref:hypothetical protein n=1 Tax=Rhizobium leguminosarum TaxID=384 RepID=UPI001C90D277|nr:hypothetical protein [Rhizobium leguminosarum]MBY2941865.1 hypothetical protein [Rhizobium leguminosarum]